VFSIGDVSKALKVEAVKRYSLSLGSSMVKDKTWGVRVDKSVYDPADACSYLEDAANMEPGWDNWKTIMETLAKPCVLSPDGTVLYYLDHENFSMTVDGDAAVLTSVSTGDVMVEFSKMGFKIDVTDEYLDVYVTTQADKEGFCYDAFSLDSSNDCDKIYIGSYLGTNTNNKLYSIVGGTPRAWQDPVASWRTWAAARGDGYQTIGFYQITLLQCLFLLIFCDRNSESVLGKGRTDSSADQSFGLTNAKGFCFGDAADNTIPVKFLGIEDMWSNFGVWVDGLYCDSSYNLYIYWHNFDDVGTGNSPDKVVATGMTADTGNYMTDVQGGDGGFVLKSVGASSSTYWCDYGDVYANYATSFGDGAAGVNGMFRMCIHAPLDAASNWWTTGRLIYKHKAEGSS